MYKSADRYHRWFHTKREVFVMHYSLMNVNNFVLICFKNKFMQFLI